MKEISPAHQHYPRDFQAETFLMSAQEAGIYIWLRGICWLEGQIPADIPRLARACKVSVPEMQEAWENIQGLFSHQTVKGGSALVEGWFIHPGVEKERAKQAEWREKSAIGGLRSVESRKRNKIIQNVNQSSTNTPTKRQPTPQPNVNQTSTLQFASAFKETTPIVPFTEKNGHAATLPADAPNGACLFGDETPLHHESVVRSTVPTRSKNGKRTTEEIRKALNGRFSWWEAFWRVYPCHDGMNPGMSTYERTVKTEALRDQVQSGAERYAAKYQADPEMRLKHAQGWLNDQRWTDQGTAQAPAKANDFEIHYPELRGGK